MGLERSINGMPWASMMVGLGLCSGAWMNPGSTSVPMAELAAKFSFSAAEYHQRRANKINDMLQKGVNSDTNKII